MTVLCVGFPAAGSETEWQSMQAVGCAGTLGWNAPGSHVAVDGELADA